MSDRRTSSTPRGRAAAAAPRSPLRVVFAGAGRVADVHHASLRKLGPSRARLVGFCETRADARAARSAEWGVPGFARFDELLDRTRPGAVVVLLPHDLHLPFVTAAVGRGLPVLLEKPLAATRADARAIVRAVERSRAPVLVGHNGLFHPAFERVAAAVRAGWVGRPLLARGESAGWLTFRPWDFRLRAAATGGGCWADAGSHLVYCLRELLGDVSGIQATAVNLARAEMEGDDHALVTLRYRSGAIGQLTTSYGHKLPGYQHDWPNGYRNAIEVYGDRGAIRYQISPDPRVDVFSEHPAAPRGAAKGWVSAVPREPYTASFDRQMAHFVTEVAPRAAAPRVTPRDALAVLETLLAAYDPAATRAARVTAGARAHAVGERDGRGRAGAPDAVSRTHGP